LLWVVVGTIVSMVRSTKKTSGRIINMCKAIIIYKQKEDCLLKIPTCGVLNFFFINYS